MILGRLEKKSRAGLQRDRYGRWTRTIYSDVTFSPKPIQDIADVLKE